MTPESSTPETRDLVILGSGCAGLTAAIYAARSNLKPLVLEGHEPGGQLSITTLVENFPGWPDGIQGPELIENMKKQAQRFGAEFRMAHLSAADLQCHPIKLQVGAETIHTRTVIIASGASARWLNLPSEQALIGHGVSSCATCDGFFASGKEIAVIGGGDSAMEEALFLTRFASKVTLINRTAKFRASPIMLERAKAHPQIHFLHSTIVEEVLGVEEKDVKGLRLKNTVTGDQFTLPVSFMFLGIGHIPNAQAFRGMMDLDRRLLRRRHQRPQVPSGDHRRRLGLHGRPRSRKVPRSPRPLSNGLSQPERPLPLPFTAKPSNTPRSGARPA
jgi:thioredoxin reductase (NADPH)